MKIRISCVGSSLRPIVADVPELWELSQILADAAEKFVRRLRKSRSKNLTVWRRDITSSDNTAYFQIAHTCEHGGLDLEGYDSQIAIEWKEIGGAE